MAKTDKDIINITSNKAIFDVFYSKNSHLSRPNFIKLYNKNNKTSIKDDYNGEEDVYNYQISDLNKSFKDKSFALCHDKKKNGIFIQKIKNNIANKIKKWMGDGKDSDKEENINAKTESINIANNLKVWKKNELNFIFHDENIFKYRHLKQNKNFICINSSKHEKLLKLERKRDIIKCPNISLMQKINNSKKTANKKLKHILSKFFINEDETEPNLVLERQLFMKKPLFKNRK